MSNSQSATDTWPDYRRFRRLTPYLEKGEQWKKEKILEIPQKKWLPKYRVKTFYIFEFPLFSLFTSISLSEDFLCKVPACIYFTKINWKKVFILLTLGPHKKKKWQSLGNLFWQTRMRVTITQQKLRSVRLLLPQGSLSVFISDICVVSVWFITVIFLKGHTHTHTLKFKYRSF